MKLVSETRIKHVTPAEMQDGQIGIIREWGGDTNHYGKIVQRYKNDIISLGLPSGKSFTGSANYLNDQIYQIEILPSGTLLEI